MTQIVVELSRKELVELITDYLEGTLPATERVRFDAHLTDCPGCRAYLDQLRRTVNLTGALREESIPPATMVAPRDRFRDWKRDGSTATTESAGLPAACRQPG